MAHTYFTLLDYFNHLLYDTLIICSIIPTFYFLTYICVNIVIKCTLSVLMLNLLSIWTSEILKPLDSYRSSTVSIDLVMWLVVLEMNGLSVMKFTFFMLIEKGNHSQKNNSMYNCISLCCWYIGSDSGNISILAPFGLTLFILPWSIGVGELYMNSALLVLSTVNLQLRKSYFKTMSLKWEVLGQPIYCCNFLACSATLIYEVIKYSLLFFFVIKKE